MSCGGDSAGDGREEVNESVEVRDDEYERAGDGCGEYLGEEYPVAFDPVEDARDRSEDCFERGFECAGDYSGDFFRDGYDGFPVHDEFYDDEDQQADSEAEESGSE